MSISNEFQKSNPDGGIVSLYTLDLSNIRDALGNAGPVFRLTPYTDSANPIVFDGVVYQPWPIEVTGIEEHGQGVEPSPTVRLASVDKTVAAAASALGDFAGGKFRRIRTLSKYLDGEPKADPTQRFPSHEFIIMQIASINREAIELRLSTTAARDVLLPRRMVNRAEFERSSQSNVRPELPPWAPGRRS